MSIIQPGVGYTVTNSSSGVSLTIDQNGWMPPGDQVILAAQFSPVLNFQPEYVNHYKVYVPELLVDGSFVLKVARGGNVWMPQGSSCAVEKRADDITTDGTTLVVVPGADTTSPWASDDGYIVLTNGGEVAYYVYAYKVETSASSDFYIYASTDNSLADTCPASLPTGITAPSGSYNVQVVMLASVTWSVPALAFIVNQHVVGSITWPSAGGATAKVEQFEASIEPDTEEGYYRIRVIEGRALMGGGMAPANARTLEWEFVNYGVYPTDSLTTGSDINSLYLNQGGYIKVTNADNGGSDEWGVYIISNPNVGFGGRNNYPMIAVMAPGSDAEVKSTPWATDGIRIMDVCPYIYSVITIPDAPYEVLLKQYTTVEQRHQENYDCQRVKVASFYWVSETSSWVTKQWLIGTLTLPICTQWIGNREYNADDGIPSWASSIEYQTEQDAWTDPWTGYDRFNGSGAFPTNPIPV